MNCIKCGTELVPGAKYCQVCGSQQVQQAAAETTPNPTQTYRQAVNNFQESEKLSKTEFAGFWLRVAAYVLDFLILGIPSGIAILIIVVILAVRNPYFDEGGVTALLEIIIALGAWLYFALMESSSNQGTLGKMIVGIKVTDLDGNRILFGKATGRHFGKILSSVFYIGFIMVGVTEKKQGLHDILAKCHVVKKK